jgi:hypothetical protein
MCPACIESTAATIAAVGSTGGILALCIAQFRAFFKLSLFHKTKEK